MMPYACEYVQWALELISIDASGLQQSTVAISKYTRGIPWKLFCGEEIQCMAFGECLMYILLTLCLRHIYIELHGMRNCDMKTTNGQMMRSHPLQRHIVLCMHIPVLFPQSLRAMANLMRDLHFQPFGDKYVVYNLDYIVLCIVLDRDPTNNVK